MLSVVSLAAVSCSDDEKYEKGEADVEGCYGVYFPTQESSYTLDPTQDPTVTLKVSRHSSDRKSVV